MTTKTPSTAVSDKQLLKAIKDAAAEKGSVPTGIEAEKRLYGLYPKRTYIQRFGSWNAAVQKAGLQINPYRRGGQRADGTFNGGIGRLRSTGPLSMAASSHAPMEEWIEARLAQLDDEAAALKRLAELRKQEADLVARLEALRSAS
jgi:hypothetical protein